MRTKLIVMLPRAVELEITIIGEIHHATVDGHSFAVFENSRLIDKLHRHLNEKNYLFALFTLVEMATENGDG